MKIVFLPKGSKHYSSSSLQSRAELNLGFRESPKETCGDGILLKAGNLPTLKIQCKEVRGQGSWLLSVKLGGWGLGGSRMGGDGEVSRSQDVIGQAPRENSKENLHDRTKN